MRELRVMSHGTFVFDPHFGLCRLVSKAGGVATIECKRGTDTIERPLHFIAFELPHFVHWDSLDEANFEYSVHHPNGTIVESPTDRVVYFWNGEGGWRVYNEQYHEASRTVSMLFSRKRVKPVIEKLPTYAEQQAAWLKEVDYKPGDKIKVLESCASHEKGWDNTWPKHMDEYIGKVLTAGRRPDDDCSTGISLIVDELIGAEMHFPYFVLLHHNEAFQEAAWAA